MTGTEGAAEGASRTPKPVIRMLKSSGESEALSKWCCIASSRLSITARRCSAMMHELVMLFVGKGTPLGRVGLIDFKCRKATSCASAHTKSRGRIGGRRKRSVTVLSKDDLAEYNINHDSRWRRREGEMERRREGENTSTLMHLQPRKRANGKRDVQYEEPAAELREEGGEDQ